MHFRNARPPTALAARSEATRARRLSAAACSVQREAARRAQCPYSLPGPRRSCVLMRVHG